MRDVARMQATSEGDRQFPRDRRGKRLGGTHPGPAGMGTSGGVEQQRVGAGSEPGASPVDDLPGRMLGVPWVGGRQVEHLPRPPRDRSRDRHGFVAAELDDVGVDGGHDGIEVRLRCVRGHGDDLDTVRTACAPGKPREGSRLIEAELPRRARDHVEADRFRTRGDRGEDAGLVGHAADLDPRSAGDVGGVGRGCTGGDERADRGCRVARTDERLTDECAIEAERPPAGHDRRLPNARFGDDQAVVGDELAQAARTVDVHLERAEVAVVEADQPGLRLERPIELAGIVDLDERLEADRERLVHQFRELLRPMEDRQQQDEIRTGGAKRGELDRLHHEVLGEHRDGNRRSDRPQVVHRSAEPVRLAQDRDRGRATGFVGAGTGHDVVIGRRDPPGGRRRALDLGDQVEAGRREPVHDRPRTRRLGHLVDESACTLRLQIGKDVLPAAGSDLLDDIATTGGRRSGDGAPAGTAAGARPPAPPGPAPRRSTTVMQALLS